MLKILILILLAGVLLSLFSGLSFLFKDTSVPESKRLMYALGIRVSLTAALLITIFAGLYTGHLELSAPWHQH